MYKPE